MVAHPDKTVIMRLLAGKVSGPEADALKAHIRGCPSCRSVVEECLALPAPGPEVAPGSHVEARLVETYRSMTESSPERPSPNHAARYIRKLAYAAALFLIIVPSAYIGIRLYEGGASKRLTLNAVTGTVHVNAIPARVPMDLPPGSLIVSGEKSSADLSCPGGYTVRIAGTTRVAAGRPLFDGKTGRTSTVLLLHRGAMYLSGKNRGEKSGLTVVAPAGSFEPVGTEFLLHVNGAHAILLLGKGRVRVSLKDREQSIILEPGRHYTVSRVITSDLLGPEEKELLALVRAESGVETFEGRMEFIGSKLIQTHDDATRGSGKPGDTIQIIKIEGAGGEQKEKVSEINVMIDQQSRIKALLAKETRTLDEIREVFNRVDEVTLYNGRVIRGAILSREDTYRILTADGVVTVPEDEVKTSSIVK